MFSNLARAALAGCLMLMLQSHQGRAAELKLNGTSHCEDTMCENVDAIVFVHGIYGDTTTFVNPDTGFDWPKEFPRRIADRDIDVYQLLYPNEMVGWAKNINFDELASSVVETMQPLRLKKYRTIGFIAHSLGGNVVSTYIHLLKTKFGHPQRSQNAFIITLATPVLGSQWADRSDYLKSSLGMSDDLLKSLTSNNLYLRMLLEFRQAEADKELRYACRPVDLHAAYEEKYLGPILVVSPESAATSVAKMVASPVVGFALDHSQIAKPKNKSDPLYQWVEDRVKSEYARVATWDEAHRDRPAGFRLCEKIEFMPE